MGSPDAYRGRASRPEEPHAEAQAEGLLLWEMKKTAAREAWAEIEPSIRHIAAMVTAAQASHAV